MDTKNVVQTIAIVDPLTKVRIQRVGPQFLRYLARLHDGPADGLSGASSTEVICEDKFDFEIDVEYLRSLDPKEWKDQDHYHVLGIKKLR